VAHFTVRDAPCKSVINRVQGMPFDWSINPYRGCRHACVYFIYSIQYALD
jgi:DNA repair photolyase